MIITNKGKEILHKQAHLSGLMAIEAYTGQGVLPNDEVIIDGNLKFRVNRVSLVDQTIELLHLDRQPIKCEPDIKAVLVSYLEDKVSDSDLVDVLDKVLGDPDDTNAFIMGAMASLLERERVFMRIQKEQDDGYVSTWNLRSHDNDIDSVISKTSVDDSDYYVVIDADDIEEAYYD